MNKLFKPSFVTFVLLTIISAIFAPSSIFAVVPNIVNYQGRYREYGQPVTGTRTMSFTIYDALTNGNQQWTSGPQSVTVTNGIFSVQLAPAVDLRALSTGGLYLEMDVTPSGGGSPKALLPREQLTSNWYALHAMTSEDIEKSAGSNIRFSIGASTQVVITNNGYVGIGVPTPSYSLEVSSSIKMDSGLLIFADGSSMGTAGVGSVGAVSANGNVPITAGATGAGDIQFYTGSNEQMVVKYSGKVGVGTIAPDQSLSVIGNIDQTGIVISSGTGNNYFAGNIGVGTMNPQALLHLVQNGSNTHLMLTEASNDNVGPAIISQKARNTLAVPQVANQNDVLYQVRLQPYINSQYRDIGEAINVTAEDNPSGNYLPTNIQLCTASSSSNATPRLTITSTGNVGISSATPTDTLVVNGGITSSYGFFHDRGNTSVVDYDQTSLTPGGGYALNLSNIVPAGAKAVLLGLSISSPFINNVRLVVWNNNHTSSTKNNSVLIVQVAGITNYCDAIVGCGAFQRV